MQQVPITDQLQKIKLQNTSINEKLNLLQSLQAAKKVQMTVGEIKTSFSREIDNFYCDFSITTTQTIKIVITSQLDASVFQLELTKEAKKALQELNFFQSIEEIYEYIQENTIQNNQKVDKRLIKIEQNGKISLTVVSTIGKKERHRQIILETYKVEEKRQEYLQKVIKKISKTMIQLNKQFSDLRQKHLVFQKQNQQLIQKLNSYGRKIQLKADRNDQHYQKFKQSDKKFIKIQDNTTYFSLFHQSPLDKSGINYFDVKIISTAKRNVMIGIGSKFVKGISNAYTHPDFIGIYIFGQGYIWQKNNQRELNLKNYPIQNGITVTTTVNMDMSYVYWEICGVRIAYAIIPLQLKAKLLFPVIMMINVNDVILLA